MAKYPSQNGPFFRKKNPKHHTGEPVSAAKLVHEMGRKQAHGLICWQSDGIPVFLDAEVSWFFYMDGFKHRMHERRKNHAQAIKQKRAEASRVRKASVQAELDRRSEILRRRDEALRQADTPHEFLYGCPHFISAKVI